MARINTGKVVVGGLVATLVLITSSIPFLLLFGERMAAATEALNAREPNAVLMMGYLAIAFMTGTICVWLYAAIRPRFGPGLRTALIAALAVWVLRPGLAIMNFILMDLMPTGLLLTELFWNLGAICLATVIGARIYSENA